MYYNVTVSAHMIEVRVATATVWYCKLTGSCVTFGRKVCFDIVVTWLSVFVWYWWLMPWRGIGFAMRHCLRHTTWRWQPQLNPYRLGRRLEQGPRHRLLAIRTRWEVCDWWTKIATCQKQHHYRHWECEITESSRKSWRTNTRNEEIPI